MCGICGFISKNKIEEHILEKMTDALKHRGPDDRGILRYTPAETDGFYVGLGHRRLSILDLSEAGHQPMSDATGRYTIVFNGEIYNYRELYDEVSDFSMRSSTDTEVLLYLYVKHGTDCLKYLNGMFAFAIYDHVDGTLFLARDRMGEKPLYYYDHGYDFVFSSELKSIMAYPCFDKAINRSILLQYFSTNYIHPPYTIFENTYKLAAGEFLVWHDGKSYVERYYSPIASYYESRDMQETDYEKCKQTLKSLLYDSIEKRLISDVPIGSFLSGGIDSTLITAIARDIRGDSGLDSFSIGFNDPKFDESSFARESALYLNTNHHEQIMDEADLFRMLDDLILYYDEPFSDSSQLPTMLVSEFARKSVTTVLSGDGGDELFAGYTSNDTLNVLRRMDPILTPLRSIIPSGISSRLASDRSRILLEKKKGPEKIQYYTKTRENIAKTILPGVGVSAVKTDADVDYIDDWMQQRMLLDMTSYLPDEIMTKTDRASMRFSLEMRSPLLDYRIIDYSMRIPMEFKYCNGDKKHILKDILYDYIPEKIMDRPKKGFSAPIYRWLNSTLLDQLAKYIEKTYIIRQGLFDPKGVNDLILRFRKRNESSVTQIVWGYYVFQMWYEYHIEALSTV